MAIKAAASTPKQNSKRVEQAELEVSNYPCRVAQVIDLGRHHKSVWDDSTNSFKPDTSKIVDMVMLTYEFTTEFMKDEAGNDVEDKPRWMSEDFPVYALDSELATSTKRMQAFDPGFKKFNGDFSLLATEACTVTIGKRKNGKAKIGNVSPPMKGMTVPELKNPVKVFMLDTPDLEVYKSLPQWLQDRIAANLDFEGSPLQALLSGGKLEPKKEPVQVPEVKEEEAHDEDIPW